MNYPNPDIRLKENFGSVKAALLYCVNMHMNQTQAAEFLEIDRKTLRERATRFKIKFPCGYKTMDRTLIREVNRERMIAGNRDGTMGGRRRWAR